MNIEILESRIAPASVVVTNLSDSTAAGSLRAAILATNASSDTINHITFASHLHGKIKLGSSLPAISNSVYIQEVHPGSITLDGAGKYQILAVATATPVQILGLNFSHGRAANGGALSINDSGGLITVAQDRFTGNSAISGIEGDSHGGAIVLLAGTLHMSSDVFTSNTAVGNSEAVAASAEGGALYVASGGTVVVQTSTFSKNSALGGSGATAAGSGLGGAIFGSGSVTLMQTKITGNLALGGFGGGAVTAPAGPLSGQAKSAAGGGVYGSYGSNIAITGSILSKNHAIGGGGSNGTQGAAGGLGQNGGDATNGQQGGIALGGGAGSAGVVTITASTISGNLARGGHGGNGGAGGRGGNGNATTAPGAGGSGGEAGLYGPGYGGGVGGFNSGYQTGAHITVVSSTISGNTASQLFFGKGGAGGRGGTAEMGGHAVHGKNGYDNRDGNLIGTYLSCTGGGVSMSQSTLQLTQDTIALNKSFQNGGGVGILLNDKAEIDNCTIAFNRTIGLGGGLFLDDANIDTEPHVVLQSSVVYGNKALLVDPGNPSPPYVPDDIDSTLVDGDYNLVGIGSFTQGSTHNISNMNPLLGSLGFHGGPTETILFSSKSLLHDAGSNPDDLTLDQRGDSRVIGQIDIGAVELR